VKADVVRWGELAKRDPAELEGLVVLLDGGLVTVRSIGEEMRSAGGKGMHRLVLRHPVGQLREHHGQRHEVHRCDDRCARIRHY